jgi:hypothetical protein
MVSRSRQFLDHVVPAVIKPLRVLWNQVIGFVFLVFTVVGISPLVRGIREFDGDGQSLVHVGLSAVFIAVMAMFTVQSFWRAHKAGR